MVSLHGYTWTKEELNPTQELPYTNFKSFQDFFPFYLGEHRHPLTKVFHFIGTTLVFVWTIFWIPILLLWFIPGAIFGYSFAWFSHFVIEKNRPATFKHPFFSLFGDFCMWWYILTGKVHLKPNKYESIDN